MPVSLNTKKAAKMTVCHSVRNVPCPRGSKPRPPWVILLPGPVAVSNVLLKFSANVNYDVDTVLCTQWCTRRDDIYIC